MFIAAYRLFKNIKGLTTVCNQQVRYFQKEHQIQNPDIHELFHDNLCQFIGNLCNKGHNMVQGMDTNNDVRRGQISKVLEDTGMFEAFVKFYKGKNPPAICATNKNQKKLIVSRLPWA